jgi:hypothetical protein
MEHPLHPRLGEYVFKEENSPLTMSGDVGTVTGSPSLIKKTPRDLNGSLQLTGRTIMRMILSNERASEHHQ